MNTQREYLKVPEVAHILRIPRTRAYELVGREAIPGVIRIGRSIRVNSETLFTWLDEQASGREWADNWGGGPNTRMQEIARGDE